MSGIDRKAPIDRRASLRTSMRLSNVAGEEDDYDLQAMGMSDGFRPAEVTHDAAPNPLNVPPPVLPTPTATAAKTQPPRPSSISKPPLSRESFSLRHDGGMGPLDDSIAASSSSASASASGSSEIVRPESPYHGPSGPSFPYQLYTQNVRASRTPSVATTTTTASDQPYNGPSGPTHPYQLYPQNTVPEESSQSSMAPAIPVGFTSAPDSYQRRIGPEGEEMADMIGPDGHTEQLPPYTRYPDETYQRKIAGIGGIGGIPEEESASSPSASTSAAAAAAAPAATSQAMRAIPGAGGIGLATRNPEFSSTDDLSRPGATSPQSRRSVQSFQSEGSHHDVNTAAMAVVSEKKPLKKWQIMAKRKVCGVVPCWALTLTIMIIVMLAVVLGTVLGIFLNKKPKPHDSSPTMSYDATPLATMPSDLTPLPEDGQYALPLMVTRSPTTCFNDTSQAQAWNCNQVFAQLTMSIKHLANQPETSQYSMSIDYNTSYTIESNQYSYGMQPPSVQDVQLLLVSDVNEPQRGPAWAFEATYNKTVIIPENLFSNSSSTSKRDSPPPPIDFGGGGGGGTFKRKGLAKDGDKPWICSWEGTVLEVFVYPNQNNSQPSTVSTADPAPSSSSSTSSTSSTSISSSGSPIRTPTSADIMSWISERPTLHPSNKRERRQGTTTTGATATATSTSSGIFDTSKPSPSDFEVPFFPRVVKMEERRLSGKPSMQPFCRQIQISNSGAASPVLDSSGNQVEVKIVEIEQDEGNGSKQRFAGRTISRRVIEEYLNSGLIPRDSSDMSNCGCMWWAT